MFQVPTMYYCIFQRLKMLFQYYKNIIADV